LHFPFEQELEQHWSLRAQDPPVGMQQTSFRQTAPAQQASPLAQLPGAWRQQPLPPQIRPLTQHVPRHEVPLLQQMLSSLVQV
jgi:hypothetical protein